MITKQIKNKNLCKELCKKVFDCLTKTLPLAHHPTPYEVRPAQ